MNGKFGFVVVECKVRGQAGTWDVHLPHMCEDWTITDGYMGVDHAKAVASLESFIMEAQEALAALKRREQFGDQSA